MHLDKTTVRYRTTFEGGSTVARITRLTISRYRSIGDKIEINFPKNKPVVLVGENNAGKSNIVKAIQLVLGPFWPGNHEPEDNEFFERNRSAPIEIAVEFDPNEPLGDRFTRLIWKYDSSLPDPVTFKAIDSTNEPRYPRSEDRDTCTCIVVEAERNLHYHLSYASKWTLLSRLMHKFHRKLTAHSPIRSLLEHQFEKTKELFFQIPEFNTFVRELQQEFDDLVANMPHRLTVNFEAYNPINFFHALRLQAAEGNEPRTLDEMGTGEQQVLALAFAYAYAKAFHEGVFLVIEEPEAHLHPLAQQWLSRKLRSRCYEGLQILLTTHSPFFVNIEDLEGIVLVYKEDGMTRVRQLTRHEFAEHCVNLGAPKQKITHENILPFYAANSTNDLMSGLFARAVVLVEGQTELLALPVLLEKQGFEVNREGVAILNVGGKGNLAKWYRLYTAYNIPCYVVFDNDARDDRDGKKREDALVALGVAPSEVCTLVDADDWCVSDRYMIFGIDFEKTMRKYFRSYYDFEEEARRFGVDSKPFVARWAVQRLNENNDDPGWKKVEALVQALRALMQSPRSDRINVDDEVPF